MEGFVYILCAVAGFACAALLFRAYWKGGVRLLLWSSLCFTALALENVILFIDLVIVPHGPDLTILRLSTALAGLSLLIYGLIFEVK